MLSQNLYVPKQRQRFHTLKTQLGHPEKRAMQERASTAQIRFVARQTSADRTIVLIVRNG